MPPTRTIRVQLDPDQYHVLERLEAKLNLDKTKVIRLALTRLAKIENHTVRNGSSAKSYKG